MEDSLDKHIFPSPVDGNHRNEHHSSAVLGLVAAASQGYEECLKILLKDGADVNACHVPGLSLCSLLLQMVTTNVLNV